MKKTFLKGLALSGMAMLMLAGAANATLVGDTVYMAHIQANAFGTAELAAMTDITDLNPYSIVDFGSILVTDDATDAVTNPGKYTADINGGWMALDFMNSGGFQTPGVAFDGIVLWGLNDSSLLPLTQVRVDTTLIPEEAWSSDNVIFTKDAVAFNFAGFDFNDSSWVGAQFGTANPEPATMILFGTGIAGFAGAVRRRRTLKK